MKAMKKVFAIAVVVAMVMSLSLTAFAADTVVAEVSGTTYTEIAKAIEAAKENGTVKLLANVSDVTIPSGTSVTIDLNGYTISSVKDHAITNNGTLTVTGTGTVDGGSTSGKGALYNSPTGTATLKGGTFTGSKWYVIKNLGTMTISGASVVQKHQDDGGSSAIDNGYYGGGGANDCYLTATAGTTVSLTITSGSVIGGMNAIKNDDYGTLSITGGYFEASYSGGVTILNWNLATISGGTFVSDGAAGVISNGYGNDTYDKGQLTITGGDFTANNDGDLFAKPAGTASSGATTTITGGTFVGTANYIDTIATTVTSSGTSTPVFSDDSLPDEWNTNGYTAPTTATIIVHGVAGQTYTAYKIFDVTQSGSAYAYSILPTSEWLSVIAQDSDNDGVYTSTVTGLTLTLSGDGSKYNVTVTTDDEDESKKFNAAEFAKTLLAAISGKTSAGSDTANSDGTATISNLAPGYYLVDSSLGALMILDTADVATVNEKNAEPSLTKEVQEDSTETWGSTATADMQQEVSFKLTVNVGSIGTGIDKDYVITDTLPNGMTYKADAGISGWTKDTDYTIEYTAETETAPATVKITLKQSKLATLDPNTDIVITYKATVDADAVIGYPEGNTNTAILEYGTYKTVQVEATVYTYEIGEDAEGNATIVKVDGSTLENDEVTENTVKLAGVEFVLSKTVDGTTYYAVLDEVKDTDETVTGYKLKGWTTTLSDDDDSTTDATPIVTNAKGTFVVEGLDADTYVLTETATLDGYNLLNDTITVVIAEDGVVTYYFTSEGADNAAGTITVVNNTGTELPSTGGIGTTIFYVVGTVLVLGAAILLIVKKRMSAVE